MYITIGIFAHVDSGKTTLAESLLYETRSIKEKGRVDHQNTLLDYHAIERARGITVFSEQAEFSYKDKHYYLIDTPGHMDFSLEMERSLSIMDYAIIVISAVEGIQGHTETIWNLTRHYKIPCFIFLNKMDREGASRNRVMKQLEQTFKGFFVFLGEGLTPETVESIAETDEGLLDDYLEGNEMDWSQIVTAQIQKRLLYPVFEGSALKGEGILELLNGLDAYAATDYDEQLPFDYQLYKIRHNEKGERLNYLKIQGGSLKVKAAVAGEKVNELRFYQGARYLSTPEAKAGQLVVATGLTQPLATLTLTPALRVSVINENPRELLAVMRLLEVEDPGLLVEWTTETETIHLAVMGAIQLEVLQEILRDRFGQQVEFGPRQVIYQETITAPVVGKGHYEPLKHYAEIHLLLEPAPLGSGIAFESDCHVHQLGAASQNLVQQHVLEQTPSGILTGSALTDLKVTLLTGAIHEKHTHGGDLLEATSRAIRQGLQKTGCQLLEPVYDVRIEVALELMGRVLTDINKAFGHAFDPNMDETHCRIHARVPVATFMDYPMEFLSYTKGRGQIHLRVAGYEPCHNPEEIIEKLGYDSSADRSYPSGSIFCAKGAGFTVPWDESDNYMHL